MSEDTEVIEKEESQDEAQQTEEAPKHWLEGVEGVDDDMRKFVGERGVGDFITYAKQQRQAATKRAEDVAQAEGMERPLDRDSASEEAVLERMHALRPDDVAEYAATVGKKPEDLTPAERMRHEAAHAAGMHKHALRAYEEAHDKAFEDAKQVRAEASAKRITESWGADAAINAQLLDRGMKQMGLGDDFNSVMDAVAMHLTDSQVDTFFNGLLSLSRQFREGGPVDVGGEGSGSLEQQRADLEAKAVSDDLSPSEEAKLAELNKKIAEAKHNGRS